MAILLDASVLCAYFNKKDVHHKKAITILTSIKENKYGVETTTDYIVDEVLGVLSRKKNRKKAIIAGDQIIRSVPITCMDDSFFAKAWFLFKKAKKLSFTDCTLLAVMKTYNIEYIATFDKSFKEIKGITVVDK